jgi:cytochrome c553
MRQVSYWIAGLAVVVAALAWQGDVAVASNEIAESENLVCTKCHDKPGSKLLTDQGKYYELMRTLEGYEEVTEIFGKCTSCHVRKPGSLKLTDMGRRFAGLVEDMDGLRELLDKEHPTSIEEIDPGAN